MANKNNKTKMKFDLMQALIFPGVVAGVSDYTSILEKQQEESEDKDNEPPKEE